jgi:hypothetical protein
LLLLPPSSGAPHTLRPIHRELVVTPQIELSVGQQFDIERFSRAIDANADAEQLRNLAKQLLHAWHTQKAATNWVIQQQLAGCPPTLKS